MSAWFGATLSFLRGLGRSSSLGAPRRERLSTAQVGRTRRDIVPFFHRHLRLVATHHVPASPNGTAVLFGGSGYSIRSGPAGLLARMADELAASGAHTFRLDLPGVGDSEGDPPSSEAWWSSLGSFSMVPALLEVLGQIRSRFGLASIVLGGCFTGAAAALLASGERSARVAGLLLIEPELGSGPGSRALAADAVVPRGVVGRLRTAVQHRPPAGAFAAVPDAWQRAVRRIPTLVVTASNSRREQGLDELERRATPRLAPWVDARAVLDRVRIEDTNDTFTAGGAAERLADTVTGWVLARFARPERATADASLTVGRGAAPVQAGTSLGQGTAGAL